MRLFLRPFLLVLFAFLGYSALAEKLYWVDGTGNFNDPGHWSFESGGMGGAKKPSANDDVYFDENSFPGKCVINIVGTAEVHDLIFSQYTSKVVLSGLQNEKIIVHGNLKLNAYIDYQFLGDLLINAVEPSTKVAFSLTALKGNIYFGGATNWTIDGDVLAPASSIYFKQGSFKLDRTGILAYDWYVSSGVTINSDNSRFIIKNILSLPAGVSFNDNRSVLYARSGNVAKYQVSSSVHFNSNSRVHNIDNITSTQCDIPYPTVSQPTCTGACDGTMTFTIPASCAASSNPIYVMWSGGCTTLPTATVSPGSTYTVGGLCGCASLYKPLFTNDTTTIDSTYNDPSFLIGIPIADPSPPAVQNFSILKKPSCFGKCDGKVVMSVKPNFGTAPITATWNGPGGPYVHSGIKNANTTVNKDTLTGACAGVYTVTLVDNNGCTSAQTATVNVTQPALITHTLTPTNALCNSVCNGSILDVQAGGTAPFTFTWTPSIPSGTVTTASPNSTYSGLCGSAAGITYTVKTTDANGCKDSATAVVTSPPPISFTKNPASGALALNCLNTCNGSIGVTSVNGGVAPYTYAWAPAGGLVSSTSNDNSTYSNLCGTVAGKTYTCTITDANNCTVTATFTVTAPPALSHTITGTNPKCAVGQGVSTGSVVNTESGGSSPYTFSWSPGGGTQASTTANPNTYTGIPAGSYTVVVTDSKGCLDSASVTLLPATAVTGTITTTTNPTCPNLNNGKLCVTAGGGAGGFTYTWSPAPASGNSTCTAANLTVTPGGTANYQVLITDANTCTLSVTGTMTSPPQVTVTPSVTQVSCGSAPCTGSATLAASGVGPGFSYLWSCTGTTTSSITGQCAGSTCNYTVTDNGTNCKNTGSIIFNPAPPTLTVNISATSLSCNGDCSSTITSTVSGGSPGYTYSWSGSGVVPTASVQTNMCAGNYTLQITDALGCTKTATVAIAAPPVLNNTVSVTNPKCNTGATGSATVTASGGTPAYTFVWPAGTSTSGASPVSIGSNMAGGTYTVLITDNKGCKDTATVVLVPPPPVTGTITTTVDPTCPNLNNGHLCVTAGGGAGGYTYAWSPPPASGTSSCTASNLTVPPGGTSNYQVLITDINSCTVTVTGTMTSPPQATVTSAVTNPTCGSAPCTGSATLTPSGGSGNFGYAWSCSGSTASTISGQCGGTSCSYTVTDITTNCKYTGSVSFTVAPTLSVNISATAISCHDGCNSVITSTVGGGVPTYTYSWNGTGTNAVIQGVSSQSSMCSGNYTLTITDANACTQSATVAIANPPSITVTLVPTPPTCSVICNGSILATLTGGTGAITGVWSPSVSPPNATNTTLNPTNLCGAVSPGTIYTLTATDSKGCVQTNTVALISPTSLTVSVSTGNITCSNLSNGTATATVSGGTGPYTYNWDNGGYTNSDDTSGLSAGTHTLMVKDANNCLAGTVTFVITKPSPISATISNVINTCGTPCSGSAQANGLGGTSPYTYTWSPSGGNGQTSTSNLCIGNYTVTVGDNNNCPTATATVHIGPIVNIAISTTSQSVSCNNGCDGVANATASNGAPNYNMVWTSSPSGATVTTCANIPAPPSCTASGLCPGVYVITVTDANGCVSSDSLTIGNPPVLTASGTQTNAKCFGTCTGSATVTPSGGTGATTVTWADGPVGPTRSNLCPGTYTANVLDSKGCSASVTFTITNSPQFTITPTTTPALACGGLTGSIEATAAGGTSAYTFSWSPTSGGIVTTTSPTSTLSGVAAGIYSVTVTDANGCDTTIQIGLSDPGSPTVAVTSTSLTCNGGADGTATVTAGGNPPVTVIWNGNAPATPPLTETNLAAGTYTIQATDVNGCNAFATAVIDQPPAIVDHATITNANCGTPASITLTPTGGNGGPYTYSWSPGGSTSNPLSSAPGGIDTCVVSDSKGCTATFTYNITPASSLTLTITPKNPTCSYLSNGTASVTVSGGTPAYSYTWTNSGGVFASGVITSVNSLAPGTYTLDVADVGGCTAQQTFTITAPSAVTPNLTFTNNLCNNAVQGNACTGTASVTPVGGAGGTYTYSWPGIPGSPVTQSVSNVCPGNYSVIVADSNSCMDTAAFVILDPTPLTATITSTDPTCFNQCNGTATVTPSGGTGTPSTYTVTWSGGLSCFNCPTASNLCGGVANNVTVIDSNGCTNTQSFTPVNPSQISSITSTVKPRCTGESNGSVTSTTSGGTGPYTFAWSPGGGTAINATPVTTYTNIGAGTYTLVTTDASSCTNTVTVTLADPTPLSAVTTQTDAACGANDGSISILSTSGGTGTITINWLSPSSCASFTTCSNLGAGIYSVELTDSLGCKDTSLIAISNPNGPVGTYSVVNDNCNDGISIDSICITSVTGSNVSQPYSYTWTPIGGNSSCISGITPGNQIISTITDSLGCQTNTTFTITVPTVITDNGNSTNATCIGINDGTITSIASGGTGTTYTYTLDGGVATNTTGIFSGLAAGSHTVCISDSVGCTKCFTYSVAPSSVINSTINTTNNSCFGDCKGIATISNLTGGTFPYSIGWNDPNNQSGLIASNLCAGSYTATITDFNGCKATDTLTITAPTVIQANPTINSPACGLCNGTVTLTPTGGTPGVNPAYTYTWNTNDSTANIINVCAGLYQVDIEDSLGCKQTVQIPVSNPGAPTIASTATSPVCGSACSGVITTTVTGGTSPYSYQWFTSPVRTTPSINNLCAGTYPLQVKDSVGCIATVIDTIKQGVTLIAGNINNNPGCAICNGSIALNISGAAGPFTYTWSTGANTSGISAACAGTYTVFVTDSVSGCTDTLVTILNSSASGPILTVTSTDVNCSGLCNGTATVSAVNGLAPYSYAWSTNPVQTNSVAVSLCGDAGSNPYFITVTDSNGCTTISTVTITQPNPIISGLPIVSQPKCNNDCNGSIQTVFTGGTPGFTYAWSPATVVGSGGSALCPGNYSVTVTDANGCVATEFDTLINPALLTITGTVTPASCNTTTDGAINTTTSGGTPGLTAPGYTYTWSGASTATTASLSNITTGNYTVQVTDSRNCTDTASFVVNPAINIAVNAGNDTTLCSVPSLVLVGDTSGATSMQWIELPNPPGTVLGITPTITVSPVAGDTTQYVLIAQNGACSNSDTITVISNTLPVPEAGTGLTIFIGQSTTIGGSPTNPGGLGTLVWHPNYYISDTTAANPTVNPQLTTTYTVTVTSPNGCVGWDTVTVTVLPTFVIPNGFSPNGDGYNETWQIDYIYMFPNCEVEVYNRWGEQLFYSKGYSTPWNGKYQGKDVPVGTYYYVIRLNDKRFPDHFAGPLTILR